jgi:hypothetical protein
MNNRKGRNFIRLTTGDNEVLKGLKRVAREDDCESAIFKMLSVLREKLDRIMLIMIRHSAENMKVN